jgi:hypothetical protein
MPKSLYRLLHHIQLLRRMPFLILQLMVRVDIWPFLLGFNGSLAKSTVHQL